MQRLIRLQSKDLDDKDKQEDGVYDSATSEDTDDVLYDINNYGQVYADALTVESSANLYAIAIRDFIARVKRSYDVAAKKIIGTGFAYEPWTEEKMNLLEHLKIIADQVLKECQSGQDAKSTFITEIDTFEKERLTAARAQFAEKYKNTNLPAEGRMEKNHIPAIKKAINIVYQIYELFQIVDKNREDVRGSALIQAAESFARAHTDELLDQINEDSLRQTEKILSDIKSSCRKDIRDITAARGLPDPDSEDKPDIDRVQLYKVNGAFALKIEKAKQEGLARAKGNLVTTTKRAVRASAGMVVSAANMLGGAAYSVGGMAMDYWVKTEGPKPSGSSSSSSNNNARVDFPRAHVDEDPAIIDDDYDAQTQSSPNVAQHVSKTLLRSAPSAQKTIDELMGHQVDEDDDEDLKIVSKTANTH